MSIVKLTLNKEDGKDTVYIINTDKITHVYTQVIDDKETFLSICFSKKELGFYLSPSNVQIVLDTLALPVERSISLTKEVNDV